MRKETEQATIWNAASYSRISKGTDDENNSICNQQQQIRKFIEAEKDLTLEVEYADNGYSGVNLDRPAIQQLLTDLRSNKVNCVIFRDFSRLGRNYIEIGRLLESIFPFLGTRVISINDKYDSLRAGSNNENLLNAVKNIMNDYHSRDLSVKIRSQLDSKRRAGHFVGAFAPYGYIKSLDNHNQLDVDENAAKIVQSIFKWKIEGFSNQKIADKLNGLGILAPSEYKRSIGSNYSEKSMEHAVSVWTAISIARILKNEVYIGVLAQGKTTKPNHKIKKRVHKGRTEWVCVENTHEAIVDNDTFELVSTLLSRDTRISPKQSMAYPLCGMVFCGQCGNSMVRKSIPGRSLSYVYLVCSSFKNNGACKSNGIQEHIVYDTVTNDVKKHIGVSDCSRAFLQFTKLKELRKKAEYEIEDRIQAERANVAKVAHRQHMLVPHLEENIVTKKEFYFYTSQYEQSILESENLIENLKKRQAAIFENKHDENYWRQLFGKYKDFDKVSRECAVELIDKIFIHPDRQIEIKYRYHN